MTVTGGDFAATLGSPASPARSLLAPFQLDGGGASSLVIDNTAAASTGTNQLVVSRDLDQIRFATSSDAADAGLTTLNADGFGGGVTVLGGDGVNRLILDRSNGVTPLPPSSLRYVNSGRGELSLVGTPSFGPLGDEVYRPTSPNGGTIVLDGRTLDYSAVSSIRDTTGTRNLTVDLGAIDPLSVGLGVSADPQGRIQARLTTTQPTLTLYDFNGKTNVAVTLGSNDSAISINTGYIKFPFSMAIDAGGGDDTLVIDVPEYLPDVAAGTAPGQVILRRDGIGDLTLDDVESVRVVGSRLKALPTDPIQATSYVPLNNVPVARFRCP